MRFRSSSVTHAHRVPYLVESLGWLWSTSQRCNSQVLVSALVVGALLHGRARRCRSQRVVRRISSDQPSWIRRTELLVDADVHSIEEIRQAIDLLEKRGPKVETTLFAAPGLVESTKWRQFVQETGVFFQPVPRSHDTVSEPNDDAIRRMAWALDSLDGVFAMALLTSDTDFIDLLEQLQSSGPGFSIVAVIPEDRPAVVSRYCEANLEVLKVKRPGASLEGPSVRAVLDSNGDGSVHLSNAYKAFDNSAGGKRLRAFLKECGFVGDTDAGTGYLIQATAKFWFANQLGSLTVFPYQLATIAAHDEVIGKSSQDYKSYEGDLAFFLPVSSKGKITKRDLQKYGSTLARAVFRGGGPFMLQDSPDLTAQALKRLGYLDSDFNNDLAEALFCFLNTSGNKTKLRKIDSLPDSGASSSEVCEMLRGAFLSHQAQGQWQYIRKDKTSMAQVCMLLQKANLIARDEYVPGEVFEAMKIYSKRNGLPPMQTFNGLAIRIWRSVDKSPDGRAFLEVKGWYAGDCPPGGLIVDIDNMSWLFPNADFAESVLIVARLSKKRQHKLFECGWQGG